MFYRAVDILVGSVALILFSPMIAVAAALIKIDGGPVFFRQARVGIGGQTFHVFKLRTMIVNADTFLDGDGRPNCDRITKIGGVLRQLSIDELPQLLNIIRGEMTFIGPRPILPGMLPHMTTRELERHKVRPGVTGLAQVRGRNQLKWSFRFRYDLFYINHQSFALDVWILWRTALMILMREGVVRDRNPEEVNDVVGRPKFR